MDLVRQLRREKGWSQEQLAQAADLSRPTIQRVESGQRVPSKETLLALAGALGVDPSRLRHATGLAATVIRVAAIANERSPTAAELRPLPPAMQTVFADFAASRSECEEAARAMTEAGERSSAAHRERMEAFSSCDRLAKEARENLRDEKLWREYQEALAHVRGMPASAGADELALAHASQKAVSKLWEKGMAVSRLLLQFL